MEDQQPATGDLTDEGPDSQSGQDAAVETGGAETVAEASEPEAGGESATDDENVDDTTEDEDSDVAEASDETAVGMRERRPVGKWSAIASMYLRYEASKSPLRYCDARSASLSMFSGV